jgi:hypothetical protein
VDRGRGVAITAALDGKNNSILPELSYGSSLLGVGVALANTPVNELARREAIKRVDNLIAGVEGLNDLFDSRPKPALPSIEIQKLQGLRESISTSQSLAKLDTLQGTRFAASEFSLDSRLGTTLPGVAKTVGILGTAASIAEVGFDVSGAIQEGRDAGAQFLGSTSTVVIGGAGAYAAFGAGALIGAPFGPLGSVLIGGAFAGAAAFGFNTDFTGSTDGSNSISSRVKSGLVEFFEDANRVHDAINDQYPRYPHQRFR